MPLKISGLANVSYLDFVKCYDSYWMAKFLAANTRVESAKVDWTANPAYMLIPPVQTVNYLRSEERRVGKECRSRWSPYH